jgi:hypothetical protein
MNTNEQQPLSVWNQPRLASDDEVRRSRSNGGTLSPRAERLMAMIPSLLERQRAIERYDSDRASVNNLTEF